MLSQYSEVKAQCAALEAESKVWKREREESQARTEALRRDHERLTALQQRQELELEEVLEKNSQLRSSSRSLEAQHRELELRFRIIRLFGTIIGIKLKALFSLSWSNRN